MGKRALLVLTTALLMLAATAATATAAEVTVRDARGDMWRMDFEGNAQSSPDTRVGDVTRAVFQHRRAQVVIRLRYLDLRRAGDYAQYVARIQDEARRYREVQVEAGPRSWRGTAQVFNRRGDRVDCAASHRIDYTANVVLLSLPTTCLDKPRRIRATAGSSWAHRSGQVFLLDNPHNQRAASQSWTRWLRAG